MIKIRVETSGAVTELAAQGQWAAARILQRAAIEASRYMRENVPKATSLLTQSINAAQTGPLTWEVGPAVRYATWVQGGRAPGKQPPFQSILDWVKVKGIGGDDPRGAAFLIARAIGRRGVPAQDFINPAGEFVAERLEAIAEAIMREAFD